jgi:hypothetical protein
MKSSKRGEVIRSEAAVSEYQHVVEPRWMSHLSTPAIINALMYAQHRDSMLGGGSNFSICSLADGTQATTMERSN